jgi:protease PrsW
VFALQNEEAYGVYAARAAAPVLQRMAGYRSPNALPSPNYGQSQR